MKKDNSAPGQIAAEASFYSPVERLREHMQFERLISDLSARFMSIAADQIDLEIERSLEILRDFFQVDRCALLGLSSDLKQIHITHAAFSEEVWHVSGEIDLVRLFPWLYKRLVLQRQTVCIDRLDELPEWAGQDKSNCAAMGIRSFLNIPVLFEGRVSSLIVLNSTRKERTWPEEFLPQLQVLGEIIVNTVERRKAFLTLQESESRLSLTADAAGAMLWNLDLDVFYFWISERTREFFGFPPHGDISLQTFYEIVHPEDLENVRRILEEIIRSGGEGSVEFRIIRPDGSIRWVFSKGLHQKTAAESKVCLMGVSLDITKRRMDEENLRDSYNEISRLKEILEEENSYLRREARDTRQIKSIIGQSDAIRYVQYRINQVSAMDTTVLILGETGTGKGLVAQAIHEGSRRKGRPLIHVNCAVLPANLIESELFGRDKGAFTGAQSNQIGRFQLADKGTIILDEIAELPIELQAKLLRVLEQGEFERLGNPRTIKVDVRIIAATNRNLAEEISNGRFREDLFYRLNVFPVTVPPLRNRIEDIPVLVDALVKRFNEKLGKRVATIPHEVIRSLQRYRWPGNVRELENIIERAVIMSRGTELQLAEPLFTVASPLVEVWKSTPTHLEEMECSHIRKTLETVGWKIGGPSGAAHALGLKPSTLRSRMQKLHILRPKIS